MSSPSSWIAGARSRCGWTTVRDDGNQVQDGILHIRSDGFFYRIFARTEYGDLYAFAARGPVVEDEHGRLSFVAEEVRQFDPDFNSARAWDSPPERELAESARGDATEEAQDRRKSRTGPSGPDRCSISGREDSREQWPCSMDLSCSH